jgi:hypothetical protein
MFYHSPGLGCTRQAREQGAISLPCACSIPVEWFGISGYAVVFGRIRSGWNEGEDPGKVVDFCHIVKVQGEGVWLVQSRWACGGGVQS